MKKENTTFTKEDIGAAMLSLSVASVVRHMMADNEEEVAFENGYMKALRHVCEYLFEEEENEDED